MNVKFDGMHNEHPDERVARCEHPTGGHSLALRAIHLVSRLRRVADMCSSKVSVNCVDILRNKRTVVPRLPFPFIEAVAGL